MYGKTGYIPGGFLNGAASATSAGATDSESGLPLQQGLTLGLQQEFNDADAATYSKPGGETLYSGTYTWVQLDPAVSGTVPVGTPLFWLQTASGYVVTSVATADTDSPDFAGWSIDPNFGASLPYAFIQQNGKGELLFGASGFPAAYGVVVNFVPGTANFTSLASGTLTVTQSTVGYALAVGAASSLSLCRVTWPIVRF